MSDSDDEPEQVETHATDERTAEILGYLEKWLDTANKKRAFSLGIAIHHTIANKVHSALRTMTPGWCHWHITTDAQAKQLLAIRKKWLPQHQADTPEAVFNVIMRALLSRKLKPSPHDLGCDMKGNPVAQMVEE